LVSAFLIVGEFLPKEFLERVAEFLGGIAAYRFKRLALFGLDRLFGLFDPALRHGFGIAVRPGDRGRGFARRAVGRRAGFFFGLSDQFALALFGFRPISRRACLAPSKASLMDFSRPSTALRIGFQSSL